MGDEVKLVSITKNEAVIAEKVTTYKREEVAGKLAEATLLVDNANKVLEESEGAIKQLEQQISLWKDKAQRAVADIKKLNYKIDLYKSLEEAFNNYPDEEELEEEEQLEEEQLEDEELEEDI